MEQRKSMVIMLLNSKELQSLDSDIRRADILMEKYHLSKQQILEAGICSRQSLARRNLAIQDGRDIGRNGHPKNLSDADESILSSSNSTGSLL